MIKVPTLRLRFCAAPAGARATEAPRTGRIYLAKVQLHSRLRGCAQAAARSVVSAASCGHEKVGGRRVRACVRRPASSPAVACARPRTPRRPSSCALSARRRGSASCAQARAPRPFPIGAGPYAASAPERSAASPPSHAAAACFPETVNTREARRDASPWWRVPMAPIRAVLMPDWVTLRKQWRAASG